MTRKRWADVAVQALLAAAVFAVGLTAIADGDIFWHLAAGRQMVAERALLRVDPFSVSALGRPWIDVHWLFQLGVYTVHAAGGLRALVLMKAALAALGALVLARVVVREACPRLLLPFAVALALSLFLVRHLLVVRPVIATLVFLALHLLLLERFAREGRARPLLVLPVLQLVWVNCQGLAPLGPAVLGAYLVAAAAGRWLGRTRFFPFVPEGEPGRVRPLALALALSAMASLASPYGLRAALLPLELLRRITPTAANVFAREVAENVPPFVLERSSPGAFFHLPWFLGALALSFFLARKRLLLSRTLVLALLITLGLMANRNLLLLYWLAPALVALDLAPSALAFADRVRARLHRALLPAAGAAALLACAGLAVAAAAREPSLAAPTPFHFPTESARHLAALPGGGTVFAADHQGGYLIWALHPRFRPYLDTRLILRTPDEYAAYLDLLRDPTRFDAFQARHRFDFVVLPTGFPDRYLGLAQHLAASPDWTLAFTDGSESLWSYRAPGPAVDLGAAATTEALLAGLAVRFGGDAALLAAARRHLAKLDLVLGHVDQATRVLAPMADADAAARALLARCHLVRGDAAAAEALARALLAAQPDDVEALLLLARVSLARGQRAEGLTWLRRALQIDPFDAEARALLDELDPGGASN